MPPFDLHPPEPRRDYDELMERSMRRGRTLRRRRRLLQVVPPLSLVVASALTLALRSSGTDGMARLYYTNQPPSHSATPGPQPTTAESAHAARAPRATVAHAGGHVHEGPRPALSTDSSTVPTRRAVPDVTKPKVEPPVVLGYGDAVGDGTPDGHSVPAASDPALDITHMRFVANQRGVAVTMWLSGTYRTDALYLAYLTDQRSGCTLTVWLGGAYHDELSWDCAGHTGGSYVPGTTDPAPDELAAFIPYRYLPGGTRPTDRLSNIYGQTRLSHPADGYQPYDTAATAATFTPR